MSIANAGKSNAKYLPFELKKIDIYFGDISVVNIVSCFVFHRRIRSVLNGIVLTFFFCIIYAYNLIRSSVHFGMAEEWFRAFLHVRSTMYFA